MRRNMCLLGGWIGLIAVFAAVMPWIVEHYAATDNVRELFRTDRKHFLSPHAWFLILCLLVPSTASMAGCGWVKRKMLAPLAIALAAPVAGWFCLRFAVTVESIHDILGTPVLGWPFDLEYLARFSAVFCTLWFVTLLGILPGMVSTSHARCDLVDLRRAPSEPRS